VQGKQGDVDELEGGFKIDFWLILSFESVKRKKMKKSFCWQHLVS